MNKKDLIEQGWTYTGQNYADLEIWKKSTQLALIQLLDQNQVEIYLTT